MVGLGSVAHWLFAFAFAFDRTRSLQTFDDSILFKLDWADEAPDSLLSKYQEKSLAPNEAVVITSLFDEKYVCSLPQKSTADVDRFSEIKAYTGPSPHELLQPLYKQKSCTYRIEMYWTYELCHGRHLRQYHEEKEPNKRVNLQEYYLGQFIPEQVPQEALKGFDALNPPKRKVDELFLPYYPVFYVQGTICDINKKPRTTTVYYVCQQNAQNQIYSFDEIASCEYELVVLTPHLCRHPAFRPEENVENKVACYPLDQAPPRPSVLTMWEHENQWENKKFIKNMILGPDGQKFGAGTQTFTKESVTSQGQPHKAPVQPPPSSPPSDSALSIGFLSGEYCLYGGTGWWKHEYCHGKQVIQFHEDPHTGKRSEILLGMWNQAEHLRWLENNPHKAPLMNGKIAKQVSHFYGHGDVCDLTGAERNVEVRLRCRESAGSPNSITLYLLEPKPCEYVLGVESQMFCDLLARVDKDGLFIN